MSGEALVASADRAGAVSVGRAPATVSADPVRLLDLFCGAGGCSVGYHRAGFEVVGVDRLPHPDYPFELIVADALDVLTDTAFVEGFDAVAASPPCPRYSAITPAHTREEHPDLVGPVLERLSALRVDWIVENVPGSPLPGAVLMCGPAMGLPGIRRHRMFASNRFLMSPGCGCGRDQPFGIYGDHGDLKPQPQRNGRKARDTAHARQLLGIDWMTRWDDLADAIPPAYTEYLGDQLLTGRGR